MRERVDLKSPVQENCPPGSVRGARGNPRPYLDLGFTLPPWSFVRILAGIATELPHVRAAVKRAAPLTRQSS